MNQQPRYKRILLKLSGEALAPKCRENGILDFAFMDTIAEVLKKCREAGVEIGVVVGAGNIWRGVTGSVKMERARADHMGMLGTCINALALQDAFARQNIDARVLSTVEMNTFADFYTQRDADRLLSEGKVVIFGGGLGAPYFSTDTPAVVLMAKNVDGLYTADPKKDPDAKRYDDVTYAEILEKNLKAFDLTAVSFCNENDIDCYAFALSDPDNIYNAVMGTATGTKMHK